MLDNAEYLLSTAALAACPPGMHIIRFCTYAGQSDDDPLRGK
jgi:hypothetical protein